MSRPYIYLSEAGSAGRPDKDLHVFVAVVADAEAELAFKQRYDENRDWALRWSSLSGPNQERHFNDFLTLLQSPGLAIYVEVNRRLKANAFGYLRKDSQRYTRALGAFVSPVLACFPDAVFAIDCTQGRSWLRLSKCLASSPHLSGRNRDEAICSLSSEQHPLLLLSQFLVSVLTYGAAGLGSSNTRLSYVQQLLMVLSSNPAGSPRLHMEPVELNAMLLDVQQQFNRLPVAAFAPAGSVAAETHCERTFYLRKVQRS